MRAFVCMCLIWSWFTGHGGGWEGGYWGGDAYHGYSVGYPHGAPHITLHTTGNLGKYLKNVRVYYVGVSIMW